MMASPTEGPDATIANGELQTMLKKRLEQFRQTLTSPKDIAIFDERLVARGTSHAAGAGGSFRFVWRRLVSLKRNPGASGSF